MIDYILLNLIDDLLVQFVLSKVHSSMKCQDSEGILKCSRKLQKTLSSLHHVRPTVTPSLGKNLYVTELFFIQLCFTAQYTTLSYIVLSYLKLHKKYLRSVYFSNLSILVFDKSSEYIPSFRLQVSVDLL